MTRGKHDVGILLAGTGLGGRTTFALDRSRQRIISAGLGGGFLRHHPTQCVCDYENQCTSAAILSGADTVELAFLAHQDDRAIRQVRDANWEVVAAAHASGIGQRSTASPGGRVMASLPLTVAAVDGLGFAAASGRWPAKQTPQYVPATLGRLLELLYLDSSSNCG